MRLQTSLDIRKRTSGVRFPATAEDGEQLSFVIREGFVGITDDELPGHLSPGVVCHPPHQI